MLRFSKSILFICMSWLMTQSAFAEKVLFVTENLAPFQVDNHPYPPTGAAIELINAIIEEADIEAEIKFYPWARSYNIALNQKNTFIFSILRSEEREDKFHWVGKVHSIQAYLSAPKSSPIKKLTSLEQAKDHHVSVVRGSLAESYLRERGFKVNKNLYLNSSFNKMWQSMFSQQADLVVTNDAVYRSQIIDIGRKPGETKFILKLDGFSSDMFIAANIVSDKALIERVSQAYQKIVDDGRYENIMKKWRFTTQ